MADRYRQRLKKASWGWMEEHSWNQGKFPKDRVYSRSDKRGARQEDKAEIATEVAERNRRKRNPGTDTTKETPK